MTPKDTERYGQVSKKAGIFGSCFIVASVFAFAIIWILPDGRLRAVFSVSVFGAYFAAVASGIVCIVAAILSRRKPSYEPDGSHEQDAA
jgi:drug/metabolite transporter (DMT)-like permease